MHLKSLNQSQQINGPCWLLFYYNFLLISDFHISVNISSNQIVNFEFVSKIKSGFISLQRMFQAFQVHLSFSQCVKFKKSAIFLCFLVCKLLFYKRNENIKHNLILIFYHSGGEAGTLFEGGWGGVGRLRKCVIFLMDVVNIFIFRKNLISPPSTHQYLPSTHHIPCKI